MDNLFKDKILTKYLNESPCYLESIPKSNDL